VSKDMGLPSDLVIPFSEKSAIPERSKFPFIELSPSRLISSSSKNALYRPGEKIRYETIESIVATMMNFTIFVFLEFCL
jgi:hypothetical protein